MAVDQILFDYDAADAEAFFEYAGYRARRPREPLEDVRRIVLLHVSNAFLSEGLTTDGGWQELSGADQHPIGGYAKDKQKRWGFVHPILQASGDLEAAATDRRAVKIRQTSGGGELAYTVNVPYAVFHQQPDGPGTGHMPHRPFYDFDADMIENIEDAFGDWLDDIKADNQRRRGMAGVNPISGQGWP